MAYLMIAARQYQDKSLAGWYNVGPEDGDCLTTGELVDLFCRKWGAGAKWENRGEPNAPHEANFLKLDCAKLKTTFRWTPRWNIDEAMELICAWTRVYFSGGDIPAEMDREIELYMEG